MKSLRKVIIILCTFVLIIGGFIATHITPSRSIRTHIFISGHPIGAFKGTVKTNEGQYKLDKDIFDKENSMIYTIVGYNIYDRTTGNVISNYKVKKMGFLYLTGPYGEV
ncbi:hypothetical protein FC820_10900 [Clostridium sporogenes]|uniref:hypothetical protein n=1 Tax=Clostridium sporogenes TaxID=1509 RepID=UPI0013D15142|nr:hypothetical protein [Clostridium sporogenes]EJE7235128.1 hypothetical protein [Clostridium botulinum]NFE80287.1 hypothetical protein [Clostridium sporogenes]NFG68817.1 hypothetical protein [Clostridium sporogenes]